MSGQDGRLSALFMSVFGTSRLFEKLGGGEALHAIDRCMKRVQRSVDGFRGRVVRTTRDDLTALFESPDEACQAALTTQRRVADLPPASGVKLSIRAGFHHGLLVADGTGGCVSAAEFLAGLARPGQILTTGETQALLSSALQASTRGLDTVAMGGQLEGQQAFEVVWLEPRTPGFRAIVEPAPAKRVERDARLCVRYAGQVKLLDRIRPNLLLGRDAACDVTVRDRRASRHHARIERRGDEFVLSDLSTNGTFVTISGRPELLIRREEFVLRGSGVIAFAASASSPGADIAEFEHL